MGYSEVVCHICGVSFNIARIRTKDEPRCHAQSSDGQRSHGTTFVEATDYTSEDCQPNGGCSMVFRKDRKQADDRQRGYGHDLKDADTKQRQSWELESMSLPSVLDSEDQSDEWCFRSVEDFSDYSDSMDVDDESSEDDYQEDTDVENDPTNSPSDEDGDTDTTSEADYAAFIASFTKPNAFYRKYFPEQERRLDDMRRGDRVNSDVLEALAGMDSATKAPEDEVMLPLEFEKRKRVMIAAEATNDNVNNMGTALDHHIEAWFEHIAGPRCLNTAGYHGHRITMEEMQGCCTAQGLCLRRDDDDERMPDLHDEDLEQEGDWFVSGVGDHMPSRDICSLQVFHGIWSVEVRAENVRFDHNPAEMDEYAMAVHPTCLEVFKRASIHRGTGSNIQNLGNWWQANSDWDGAHSIPQAPAVRNGKDQWWRHNPGDEWLVANPCFVPALSTVVEKSKISSNSGSQVSSTIRPSSFTRLPEEIKQNILVHLDASDMAYAALAIPNTLDTAQALIRKRLLCETPHLWELWCTKPYSRWTGTTEIELRALHAVFKRSSQDEEAALNVLREEGHDEAYDACRRYWSEIRDARHRECLGPAGRPKPALTVDVDKTDFVRLAIGLHEGLQEDQLKGLRNRERIWKSCNWILDKIEEMGR